MTKSAIIALLKIGVEAIISNYEVIEEVARARLQEGDCLGAAGIIVRHKPSLVIKTVDQDVFLSMLTLTTNPAS
ncbi:hypothetical protein ILFOPFJJ_06920 [Ensifer psoraleae]|uniref:hypothetical protein n=1 Tax=Sinorhizobium psoraleae TaxID=520838 RepID=UPI001568A1F7|nr:hypothetical protein [Sinorhizobium psoraleae]NRP75996.1 hypothetical protein [Sinorhizobium psoraleae]